MCKKSCLLILLMVLHFQVWGQQYPIAPQVNRIVFLENSITSSGKFVSFVDAYFTLKYPNQQLEIINLGLPRETVSGLSELNHAEGNSPDLTSANGSIEF